MSPSELLESMGPGLKVMREHGVKSIRFTVDAVFDIQFFPPTAPAEPPESPAAMAKALERALAHPEQQCPCGHNFFQHDGEGLCLCGCPVATCARTSADDSGKTP